MNKYTFSEVGNPYYVKCYIEDAKELGGNRLTRFLRNKKILFDDGMDSWRGSDCKKPYYRLRGKPITPEQALEIIRRTDLRIDSMQQIANINRKKETYCGKDFITAINFYNIWLDDDQYCIERFGWCHPDGIIGLNSAASKYPDLEEILTEWLTYSYYFPFLDVVIAFTNSNYGLTVKGLYTEEQIAEHNRYAKEKIDKVFDFEETVILGIYLHNGTLEILNPENAVKRYLEYNEKYPAIKGRSYDDRNCGETVKINFKEYRDKCITLNRETFK